MFFLPFDARLRRLCVETVEDLASLAGADVLGWADVPFNVEALPPGSAARRTAPVVRQALFRRPPGMGEDGWFACRYLLRLALGEVLADTVSEDFSLSSLSNRTVVYRGLAQLSRIGELYPDLRDEHVASRFVLFHSRYSTNTTTAWRRAQPFWALAHNGEISTIRGNVAWMHAIGHDLVRRLVERHPPLKRLAARVSSVICGGGSDSSNLDDMLIALMAGGLSMAQGLLALLPEAPSMARAEPVLAEFHAGDERAARRVRRPGGDRRVRWRGRGGAPRSQRPAAALAGDHARLRPGGERADGHAGSGPHREPAHLRPGRQRDRQPRDRRGAVHRGRASRALAPAVSGTGRADDRAGVRGRGRRRRRISRGCRRPSA